MSWTETDPGYRGPKERPLQRNEAAERLLGELHKHYARDRARVLAEALAAERRATVERIRERLNGRGATRWSTLAHQQDDPDAPEWALDESMVLAILDEEAAR